MMLCSLLWAATAWSQSKVFKEVSEDISSQMKTITQDDALIGYLMFTQLEKASKDSFNYQVSIMDENLNDIGKLNFREKNLELQAVSFDQDVLCLVYLKSDMADLKGNSMKKIRKSLDGTQNELFTQLVNLQGEIINTSSQQVELRLKDEVTYFKNSRPSTIPGRLKNEVILKNIPGKGFSLFYGDEKQRHLSIIDLTGKETWQKTMTDGNVVGMLTSPSDVYLLLQFKHQKWEGGFKLRGYNATNGTAYDNYELKDKKGNQLKVLSFEADPATGKPLVTGVIINPRRDDHFLSVKTMRRGAYDGVFTLLVNGPKKSDIKERFSYWQDGSKAPEIKTTGMLSEGKLYPDYAKTIRDFQGNTYFVGSSYVRKVNVPGIAVATILAPFIFPPIALLVSGVHKVKQTDVVLLRQDSTGKIRYENKIDASRSRSLRNKDPFSAFSNRNFYSVTNTTSKSNFLIMDEAKGAVIYNLEKKKIVRNVPHNDGNVYTYIYPAKEGHIMVMEYNQKAKETKLSIEAL
ncbi:hypothetical protein SY85_07670 [Flavisolibacter tropicus]|uniref:Uncharacterized protein n=2 Tax=Flavisolibacter tropicus TaxID=1492898 RepID=A0A172TTN2_9BACT|nr:hypothetical protein SY85_07670 [Flavisolibacter tropicus]